MSEAIVEMSAKGFGCVAVTTATASSPAWLRMATCGATCASTLLQAPVDEVMTKSPKIVRHRSIGQRGAGAAQFIEDHGAFRRRRSKPVGIVHFHDLLRAGVA